MIASQQVLELRVLLRFGDAGEAFETRRQFLGKVVLVRALQLATAFQCDDHLRLLNAQIRGVIAGAPDAAQFTGEDRIGGHQGTELLFFYADLPGAPLLGIEQAFPIAFHNCLHGRWQIIRL